MTERIIEDEKVADRRKAESEIFNSKSFVSEKAVMQKINLKNLVFAIDPIQQFLTAIKAQKMPMYAEALNRNMSGLFYNFINYKVEKREVITLEAKGQVRCLSNDTEIKTVDEFGVNDVRLRDLDDPFNVLSFNFQKKILEAKPAQIFDAGRQMVFDIKTKSGKVVHATKNHKFFVMRDGKVYEEVVANIKVGDKIVTIEQ